jgi:HK97 gp10 family phage protein
MPSNIHSVIKDIEDVKKDVHRKPYNAAIDEMAALQSVIVANVAEDASWTGQLSNAIKSHGVDTEDSGHSFRVAVGVDTTIAPYAGVVEFGSGSRLNKSSAFSLPAPTPDTYPYSDGYPYESPSGVSEGLLDDLEEWVKTKPVVPKKDSDGPEELAQKIAHTIVEKGTYAHPFLRPAWFNHSRIIKQTIRMMVRRAFR